MRALAGVGVDLRSLELDTAIAAYLIDPAENRYALGRPPRPLHGRLAAGRRRARGPARPRRRRHRRRASAPPAPALAVSRLAPALDRGARQAGHARALRRDREPARRACWPAWRTSASASTPPSCAGSTTASPTECQRLAGEVYAVAGREFNLNSPTAAAPDPVRRARPGAPEAHQDRLLHRRRVAREAARPVARVHRPAAVVPRGREAAVHLRRGPAGGGGARRAHPRHVQPDRRPHRPAVVATSRTCTTSRCAPRRAASSAGRSCPRPGTCCWSPTTTRSSCAASPTWPRTRA